MRNRTASEIPLKQWQAKQAPGSIALTLHHGSDAYCRPPALPRIDEQRLGDLAQEILAAAIKLAAMLEVAQQISSAKRNNAAEMAGMEGDGNV
jgi:hypothetical protein